MIRYVVLKEETCAACNGDGWRITEDDDDLCPECNGLGHTMEEVATVDNLEEVKLLLPEQPTNNPLHFQVARLTRSQRASYEA